MSKYNIFYRNHGVRQMGNFKNPNVEIMSKLVLPRNSILHYLSYDDVTIGPETQSAFLVNFDDRVLVEHITNIDNPLGGPRPNAGYTEAMMYQEYHRRYRKIRPLHDFEKSASVENTLIIENYAQLNYLFRYQRSRITNFYKWHNIAKSLFENIAKKTRDNSRQHFITFEVPKTLIAPKWLQSASIYPEDLSARQMEGYATLSRIIMLEVWKILGGNKEVSLLKDIDNRDLQKVNLIIYTAGVYTVLNIGKALNLFNVNLEDGPDTSATGNRAQRGFLRLLVSMISYRSGEKTVGETKDEVDHDDAVTSNDQVEDEDIDDEKLEEDVELVEAEDEVDSVIEDDEEGDEEITPPIEAADVALQRRIEDMARDGRITAGQEKRFKRLLEKSDEIPNPFGEGTIKEFGRVTDEDITITEDDVKLPDTVGVVDQSMSESSIGVIDSKYINNVMDKHISSVTMGLEQAGVIVEDVKMEEVEDEFNHYRTFRIKVQPIDGQSSTLRFRLPVVQEDGTYMSNGVKLRMRKQFSDHPIRKISPSSVSITSYYAKVFVARSEKKTTNYGQWVLKNIISRGMDNEDTTITNLKHTKTFDHSKELPRIYTILSQRVREFTVNGDIRIYVDYNNRKEEFKEEVVDMVENQGFVFVGMRKRTPIAVDMDNIFYTVTEKDYEPLGSIEELTGLDNSKAPVEMAEFRLFHGYVPVGLILGYFYGIDELMSNLSVSPRRIPVGSPLKLSGDEYVVRFSDESLVFNRDDRLATLIMSGFNRYHQSIKKYPVDSFNRKDVYANVFEDNGLRVGFMRELDLSMDMFVDPITLDILQRLNEPTTLDKLILRGCELLLTDHHPKETSMESMRIRGYERFAGTIYSELVRSVRGYRSRGIGTEAKLDMNPEAVWQQVAGGGDSSVIQTEDLNPIHDLKQKEIVTFMGSGGRSSQSMVKHTRAYDESHMGVVSEATVDSGAVGVNAYLTANPNFKNLYGMVEEYDPEKTSNTSMVSTSMLNAPSAEHDDPKRINFISIQNTHTVPVEGYGISPLRTGYEKILAHRSDDLYAYTAKQNGKVLEVKDDVIKIEYKDGTIKHLEIGRRYGTVSGGHVAHNITTDLSEGDTFKEGETICYNDGFFQPDPLDPKNAIMKQGILTKTALIEGNETIEDASAISEKIAKRINTRVTNERIITVSFEQVVKALPNIGDELDIETILCTIEDPVADTGEDYDSDTMDAFQLMSTNTPLAKYAGKLEDIEVLYHGDIEDMSVSLREVAERSDKARKKKLKGLGKKPSTGQVDGFVRVGRESLPMDTAALKFKITTDMEAGIGDKGTLGNQMKTVFSSILTGTNETESGEEIDVLFSYMSVSNRIILSPEIMGTTNTILLGMSKMVADAYFEK